MDTQQVELAGRNWLTSELIRAGLEVARPERDRGIDLIVYRDRGMDDKREFLAYPIQMKAATKEVFRLDPKYEKIPGLILVYVWYLGVSANTKCFAMTYTEALDIADEMGWTATPSWIKGGRHKRRGYSTTKPSKRLRPLLTPFEMDSTKWWSLTSRFKGYPGLFEGNEIDPSLEVNLDNLTSLLRKRFPNRSQSTPELISELVGELHDSGYRTIGQLENIVREGWDLFLLKEEQATPSDWNKGEPAPIKYSEVGVFRSIIRIVDKDFEKTRRKTAFKNRAPAKVVRP